jgi:hypothetical protein
MLYCGQGLVVPADNSRAVELWKHAESKGDLDAGHNLALNEYKVESAFVSYSRA